MEKLGIDKLLIVPRLKLIENSKFNRLTIILTSIHPYKNVVFIPKAFTIQIVHYKTTTTTTTKLSPKFLGSAMDP